MKKLITLIIFAGISLLGLAQDTTKKAGKDPTKTYMKSSESSSFRKLIGATPKYSMDNVAIFFGQTYAQFRYRDSQGSKDENLSSDIKSAYGVNFSKFINSGFFFRAEFGYMNLGGSSILNKQKLDWSLHYLDLNIGAGYLVKLGALNVYGGGTPYVAYLYKANQTIGNSYYDMLENEGIKRSDYGINLFAGLKYGFTKANAVFFEVRNTTGLNQLEPNSENGEDQHLYNRAVSFQFGMSFNLLK